MKNNSAKHKSLKGNVGVENFQGRIRLRLPRQLYEGKQKYLSLGLSYSSDNLRLAEAKAKQIESDIVYERFDPTLAKYKPQSHSEITQPCKESTQSNDLIKLWNQYIEHRKPQVSPTTVANQYAAVASHLKKMPATSLNDALIIYSWLTANLTLDTAKRTLVQLNACCKWAKKTKLIIDNPFDGMATEIRVSKQGKSDIDPFTKEEQIAIIDAFENTKYITLVKFLFLTGCRTGEALGLKWKHISQNFKSINFTESLSGQQRFLTDTKTHKPRKLPCNSQLQLLLQVVKNQNSKPEDLVFDIGFVRTFQANWKRRIKILVIEGRVESYRPQYNTRHTFITNCLESGVSVTQISKWVGNSPEIIMKHYAGIIKQVEVPEF